MHRNDRLCELLRVENRILQMIASGAEALPPILGDLCRAVREQFDATGAGIFLLDCDAQHLSVVASAGLPSEFIKAQNGGAVGMSGGSGGAAAFLRRPVVTTNIPADPLWRGVRRIAERHNLCACWTIPVVLSDDSLAAVFSIFFPQSVGARQRDLGQLERLARLVGLAIERDRRDRELRHRVHHDDLTGLPNRWLLMERLNQAVAHSERYGGRVAVLLLDLDGFKPINDRLGHRKGDAVLVKIARRIRSEIRQSDTVARFGGDEFVVLLKEFGEPADAVGVAEKLVRHIGEPLRLGKGEYQLGASIGVSLFPDHAHDAEGLIDAADEAMYAAKRAGGTGYCLFGRTALG